MKVRFLLLAAALIIAFFGYAQTKKVIADKIIGQVGDKIILRSDIVNAVADMKRGGQQLPENAECALVESQLIQKALVLQAEKDSLPISDEELEASLDNRVRYFISMYGSKEVLEEIAGKTVYQLKEDFRLPMREQNLAEQMRKKIVDNVKITPTEVRDNFNKIPKDSLPFYETELELSEIVMYPKANRDVESYVTRQLNDLKRQVETGEKNFEQLVKLYSEDPAVKENMLQYNLNRNDKNTWDPTFLAAAFKLKEGQISPVIKSKFGLHIIQLVSRFGDDAVVRHILKIPPVTQDEVNETIVKLDSVRVRLVAGSINFGAAVNKYSEDDGSKFSGGRKQSRNGSNYVTIDELVKDEVLVIQKMKVGEYSQPVSFSDERGKKGVRLIHLQTRTEPHRENLKDDYSRIAQRALEEKKMNTLQDWFKTHIPSYYIAIDKEFAGCESVKEWVSHAVVNK